MNYSLRSVAEKVRSLQSASATNDKIALLKEYLQDDIFRRCFVAAYSESTDFKINKLKFREGLISAQDAARHFGFSELSEDIILLVLKRISKQKGVSALDKMHLATLASVDKDTFSTDLGRQLFYVGASRARFRLIIVANLSDDDCKKLKQFLHSSRHEEGCKKRCRQSCHCFTRYPNAFKCI